MAESFQQNSHIWNKEILESYLNEIEQHLKKKEIIKNTWSQKCYEEPNEKDHCYGCIYLYMRCKSFINLKMNMKTLDNENAYIPVDQFYRCYCNDIHSKPKKSKKTLDCICYESISNKQKAISSSNVKKCKGLNSRKCTFSKHTVIDRIKHGYICTVNDGSTISTIKPKMNCSHNFNSTAPLIERMLLNSKIQAKTDICLVMSFETATMKINILLILIPLIFAFLVMLDRHLSIRKKKRYKKEYPNYKKLDNKKILKF